MLASRGKMSAYCHQNPESGFDGSYTREYGFRVDTDNHSYLFRLIILWKGVEGYSTTDIPVTDRTSAQQMVDHYNTKLGVTKAQEAAMKAGSMFGWEVPAADPKSYNEDGHPLPVKGNRYDAISQSYDSMEIFDQPVIFFSGRIDRSTVPDGMYMYEIRHSDEDWGEPVQIGRSILVNHYGTIISSKPIDIPSDGLREISAEDWGFTDEGITNLADYAKKYPPTGEPPNKNRKNDAR